MQLKKLDSDLDAMLQIWVSSLIVNLEDPVTRSKLELLQEKERTVLQHLMKTGKLPASLDSTFVQALKDMLCGRPGYPG